MPDTAGGRQSTSQTSEEFCSAASRMSAIQASPYRGRAHGVGADGEPVRPGVGELAHMLRRADPAAADDADIRSQRVAQPRHGAYGQRPQWGATHAPATDREGVRRVEPPHTGGGGIEHHRLEAHRRDLQDHGHVGGHRVGEEFVGPGHLPDVRATDVQFDGSRTQGPDPVQQQVPFVRREAVH
ncbi:MAG: hypothetical protein U0R64_07315 [Candidatus Nanopelagicales bacterium]